MNIDIIVPVFNCEYKIKPLIEEINRQNVFNDQIIIVNDGSTDNTSLVCEELAKEFSHILLINQENTGPALARQKGLECAQNEFVWFVDADDSISANALQIIHNNLSSSIDILCFGMKIVLINNHGKNQVSYNSLSGYSTEMSIEQIIDVLISNSLFNSLCTKVFKKSFLINNEISFERINLIEDVDFIIKAFKYNPTVNIISDCLYIYKNEIYSFNTVSSRYYPDRLECGLKLNDLFYHLLECHNIKNKSLENKLNSILLTDIYTSLCMEYSHLEKTHHDKEINTIINSIYSQEIRNKIKNSTGNTLNLKLFRFFYLYLPQKMLSKYIKLRTITKLKIESKGN